MQFTISAEPITNYKIVEAEKHFTFMPNQQSFAGLYLSHSPRISNHLLLKVIGTLTQKRWQTK
ncbi:MAG: hypothetical protein EBZ53_07580 [Verrucomicrobia bacterium]|nr:hypothetical protein [Verrucomicrobiota bacterium]